MNKRTIIGIIACVLAIVCVANFGVWFIMDATDNIGVMSPGYKNLSQVIIHADGKVGRGVIFNINDDYIEIITAKHVVSETATPVIEFGDGTRTDSVVRYYFADHDAAVIRIDKNSDNIPKGLKAVETIDRYEYNMIYEGNSLYFASSLKDKELEVLSGNIARKDYFVEVIQEKADVINCIEPPTPGMSGSGVFTEDDQLYGIIVAADESTGVVLPIFDLMNIYGGYNE